MASLDGVAGGAAAGEQQWLRGLLREGVCHGCGTCAGVCPRGAIRMVRREDGTYVPVVVGERCTGCGLCERVCPAAAFDPSDFEHLFGPDVGRSLLLGRYLEAWIGHASDQALRYQATSGGIATAALSHALRSGLIDAAVVVRMSREDALLPEVVVARTESDIGSAMGSKYVPVPVGGVLRHIRRNPGRYAVVGLPCHVRGVRAAMAQVPGLAERIPFLVGLVCAHTMLVDGFGYVLRSLGARTAEVEGVFMSGVGWPGGLTVRLSGGRERFLPRLHSLFADVFGSHLFTPSYCFHCRDLAAELADVVLADAWLPSVLRRDRLGTSLVMVRTEAGRRLIASARSGGAIALDPCPVKSFARSQRSMLYFKKRSIAARQRLCRVRPRDRTRLLNPRLVDYPVAVWALLARWYGSSSLGRKTTPLIPSPLLRLARSGFKVGVFAASRGLAGERTTRQILITNQHTDNRGDQAALCGVLAGLRRLLHGYEYRVLVQSPETDPLPKGEPDVQATGMLTKYGEAARALAYVLLRKLAMPSRWLLKGRSGRALRAYEEAEVVISAPGGPYLGDLYVGHEHAHLFHIWLAQALGRPTVLYAPSAGPFSGRWRNAIRRAILKGMTVLCVREEISRDHLIRLGVPRERVEVVPDAALNYPVARYAGGLQEVLGPEFTPRELTIGFTPCQWRYPGDPDPEGRQRQYVTALARVLDRCVEEYDAAVVAFPQLFGRHSDIPFIEQVRLEMRHGRRCHVFPSDRDCLEQQAVIGRMDMFIATRYHSQIFAAKMGVPSVCVAYEHKARGFMRLLGLEKHVLDIEQIEEGNLWQAITRVWEEREQIRAVLAERIPQLAEAAARASLLCVRALSSSGPR